MSKQVVALAIFSGTILCIKSATSGILDRPEDSSPRQRNSDVLTDSPRQRNNDNDVAPESHPIGAQHYRPTRYERRVLVIAHIGTYLLVFFFTNFMLYGKSWNITWHGEETPLEGSANRKLDAAAPEHPYFALETIEAQVWTDTPDPVLNIYIGTDCAEGTHPDYDPKQVHAYSVGNTIRTHNYTCNILLLPESFELIPKTKVQFFNHYGYDIVVKFQPMQQGIYVVFIRHEYVNEELALLPRIPDKELQATNATRTLPFVGHLLVQYPHAVYYYIYNSMFQRRDEPPRFPTCTSEHMRNNKNKGYWVKQEKRWIWQPSDCKLDVFKKSYPCIDESSPMTFLGDSSVESLFRHLRSVDKLENFNARYDFIQVKTHAKDMLLRYFKDLKEKRSELGRRQGTFVFNPAGLWQAAYGKLEVWEEMFPEILQLASGSNFERIFFLTTTAVHPKVYDGLQEDQSKWALTDTRVQALNEIAINAISKFNEAVRFEIVLQKRLKIEVIDLWTMSKLQENDMATLSDMRHYGANTISNMLDIIMTHVCL